MSKYINLAILLLSIFFLAAGLNRNVIEPKELPTGTKVVYILKPTVNYLLAENILEDFVNTCSEGRVQGYTLEVVNNKPTLLDKACY